MNEVPGKYKTAGTTMMVAGIFNILWSLFLGVMIFLYASVLAISTLGLGCVFYLCMFWPLIPLAMGIVEVVIGAQAMQGKPLASTKLTSIIGLVVGVINMSLIPIILEIVTIVSLNDNEVAGWLEENS